MQFELVVKRGVETLAQIQGVDLEPKNISFDDAKKVIEVEQYLERIFGYRFHINQVK